MRTWTLPAYFGLAFVIAWSGIAGVALRTGLPAPAALLEPHLPLVFLAMLAGPVLASLTLTAVTAGRQGLGRLLAGYSQPPPGIRWYGLLLIAPGAMAGILALLSQVAPVYQPALLRAAHPATLVAMAAVAGLGAGFLEELGWTGFATPRLLAGRGWLRAGLVLGVVWGLWHGLADYWGGIAQGALWPAHFAAWVVALTGFRVLMTWAFARTRSLLLAALLHASFTGGQALLWPTTSPRQELLWYGLFAIALWIAVGILVARDRSPHPPAVQSTGH